MTELPLEKRFCSGCSKLSPVLNQHYMCPTCIDAGVYEKRAIAITNVGNKHRAKDSTDEAIFDVGQDFDLARLPKKDGTEVSK